MMARPTAADLGLNLSADAQQRVDWSNWTLPPYNRWAFQHVQELTRTTRVSRSPQFTELVHEPQELGGLEFTAVTGDISNIDDMLDDTWTDGFLVMHRGKVVTEQYFNDMQPDTLHLLMSCSKSLTSAAVGIAVEEGSLELARNITDYLPELGGSGFSGATVQQALDMQVGIKFDEDYENLDGEWRDLEVATCWRPPGKDYRGPLNMLDYMRGLQADGEHGRDFHYQSVLTDAVGLCLERAVGRRFVDYFCEKVWHPLGAEHDLVSIVDDAGYPIFEGGFNCSLRDFARFAGMICNGGSVEDKRIVPAAWIDESRFASDELTAVFGRSEYAEMMPGHAYHNKWWIRDTRRGVMMALGIHGQTLFVDPERELAIAKFSSQPDHVNPGMTLDQFHAFEAIAEHLS